MIKRLDKVFIYVGDIARAKRFYGEVLGLPRANAPEGDIAFDIDGIQIILVPDRERGCPRTGADICLWTPDIEATYGKLVVDGVNFFKPPTRESWGGWFAGLFDSEGNRIYLIQY
ncbi:hypothetical protein DRQ36_06470 [bacterium]|nr:MAG: hypothetical protein DRQ36_06470 [bacterium]